MTRPIVRRFRLLRLPNAMSPTGRAEDVMGGPMGEGNVYVTTYGSPLPGEKPWNKLEVGERSEHRFSLSGSTGVYTLERIEDGPRPEDS